MLSLLAQISRMAEQLTNKEELILELRDEIKSLKSADKSYGNNDQLINKFKSSHDSRIQKFWREIAFR